MVSRRKPAALGVRALLAQGRRADLEELRSDRAGSKGRTRRDRRRRALRRRHRRNGSASTPNFVMPAFEDPASLAAEGRRAAGECRSGDSKLIRSGSTRAHGADVRRAACRSRPASSCRCSAGMRDARLALEERAMAAAPRQIVPDAGRFPARLAPADRIAAVGSRRRLSLLLTSRTRWRLAARCRMRCGCSSSTASMPPAGARQSSARRGRRQRAHRAQRRAARRRPARLHAAGDDPRRLSGTGRRRRGDGAGHAVCRFISRAIRRPSIRASMSSR